MSNKRVLWLSVIAGILLIARIVVSLEDIKSPGALFNIGSMENYQLDTPEARKLNILKSHPVLVMAMSSQSGSSAKKENRGTTRNPFLFGRPVAPERIQVPRSVEMPVTVIEPEKTKMEYRFSGELQGMTVFPESGKKTVLLYTSQETLLLKEGEMIDERYRVKLISREKVTIIDTVSGQKLDLFFTQ
jgi:hypothetical protein